MKFLHIFTSINFVALRSCAQNLLHCKKGATTIEYGVMGALIAITLIAGSGYLGQGLDASFKRASAGLEQGNTSSQGNEYKEVTTTGIK